MKELLLDGRTSVTMGVFLPALALAALSVCGSCSGAEPDVASLIKGLNDSRHNRLVVMHQLGNLGAAGKQAVPILAGYLRMKDQGQADQAARALAQIGPASVPDLVKALGDPKPEVQKRALAALGILGPEAKAAVEPVSEFLRNPDVKLRALAAEVLAQMGPAARPAVAALGAALHDSDASVRLLAVLALHEIGDDTVTELLPLLKDKHLPVRLSAVQALPVFHESKQAVAALVGTLHDREVKIRTSAATALIRLGPAGKAALPALLDCLKEKNRELQTEAFAAIMSIGSWRDAQLLEGLTAVNEKARWAPAAGSNKSAASLQRLKHLRTALEDANPTRCLGAVLALGQMGPAAKAAVPALIKMRDDPNQTLQAAVLCALHAVDPRKHKDTGKAIKLLSEITAALSSAGSPETEDVIQLYLVASTILSADFGDRLRDNEVARVARKARNWSAQALDKLPYSLWTVSRGGKSTPSSTSRGMMPLLIAAGPANGCRPKRNGNTRLAAGWTGNSMPGAISSNPAANGCATSGKDRFPRRTAAQTASRGPPRPDRFRPTATAFMTCPATSGNGALIFTGRITTRRVRPAIRRDRNPATIPTSPACRNGYCAAGHFSVPTATACVTSPGPAARGSRRARQVIRVFAVSRVRNEPRCDW